jgi:hypothetical protein
VQEGGQAVLPVRGCGQVAAFAGVVHDLPAGGGGLVRWGFMVFQGFGEDRGAVLQDLQVAAVQLLRRPVRVASPGQGGRAGGRVGVHGFDVDHGSVE